MNIIVVGCGKIGSSIASHLCKKHNLTVIDTNPTLVSELSTSLDILGICGNGASYSVLEEADVKNAELLIAATSEDEINILCCLLAKKMANCKTIARIRNPIYKDELHYLKEDLGLSLVINPEYTAATEISKFIRFPDYINVHTFANGGLELIEFKINENSSIANKTLIEIGKIIDNTALICVVQRGESVYIPRGSFKIEAYDTISVICKAEDSYQFLNKIKMDFKKLDNAMIIGGGKISYYLVNELNKLKIHTKIIEIDKNLCEKLSASLDGTTVICGDASNQELLYEEGILDAEAFVSLTNIDEENIMLSLFATKKSKAKVVTKINRTEYEKVLDEYDLGFIVRPKEITANYINAYVEAMEKSADIDVEVMYTIVENKAVALEFLVKETDDFIINKELKTLKFKEGLIIAAIKRDNKVLTVNGTSIIKPHDLVIVVTRLTTVNTIKDIMA